MRLVTKIWKNIVELFSKLPLIGGLVHCKFTDHKYAFIELSFILFFSFTPLLIAFIVAYLKDHNISIAISLADNIQHGELFLYVASILSPIFFIILRKRDNEDQYPNKLSHILVYIVIMLIAAIIFALQRVNFTFDPVALQQVQMIVFTVALILLYLVLVYNNWLLPNPTTAFRDEEAYFSDEVNKHRSRNAE